MSAQAWVLEQAQDLGGEVGLVLLGNEASASLGQDLPGPHDGGGDHRDPQGHGLQQDQALGLGARGEDEGVAGAITVRQGLAPFQIADEPGMVGQAEAGALGLQGGPRRALAGHHQQQVGDLPNQPGQDLQQEPDVLFEGDAPDVDQDRAVWGYAMGAAEARPIAGGRRSARCRWV